jgi:hypothetical protein
MKKRYFLDMIMSILMIVLMGYQVTGNHWHEIIGTGLLVLFIIHLSMQVRWFKNIHKIAKNAIAKKYLLIGFITDILIFIDMIGMAITSVMISREVFASLNLTGGMIFVYLHNVFAYGGLILISIHLGCHWKVILFKINQKLGVTKNNGKNGITIVERIAAFTLAAFGVFASFERNIGSKFLLPNMKEQSNLASASMEEVFSGNSFGGKQKKDNTTPTISSDDSSSESSSESLNDYLSKLTCTGCSKHCCLLTPQCSVGRQQAQQATAAYQEKQSNSSAEQPTTQDVASDNMLVVQGDDDLIKLFKDYIPIMGLYVCGTYYAIKLITTRKNG